MLWENVDVQRMTASSALREPHSPPLPLLPALPAHEETPFALALYHSRATNGFFEDADYYPDLLDRWGALAQNSGAQVTRVSSVESLDSLDGYQVLVVPSAVCLSGAEVSAMRAFAEEGGGLVVTWAAGARDSTCTWLGWEALNTLTDTTEFRTLQRREALYLTIPAGLPFAVGFSPATRVELRNESQLTMATTGTRLYWSDWAMNSEPADDAVGMDAAAWSGRTAGGGRIVWFGFRLGQGASERDEEYISRLFANGLRWAAGVPMAQVAPWPNGGQAALVITQDVELHFPNAARLSRIAREKAVPVTFFVVSQLAAEHPEIADSLLEVGEIGSHSSDHAVVAGRPYVDQRARLSRSQAELRNWAGTRAYGFRPPEERFDESTLRAWTWTGGKYLVGVNEARSGSPEVFDTPDGKIALLPRIVKNDYNVYVQDGAMRSRRLTEAFLAGMKKVNALGALAVVSLRTQVGGEGDRVRVIAEVVDSARASGDWWFATGHEMARWWLSRWESSVEVHRTGETQLEIKVNADSGDGLKGAWLELFLPGRARDWVPTQDGALLRHVRTEWGITIPLADIAPGGESIIDLEADAGAPPT